RVTAKTTSNARNMRRSRTAMMNATAEPANAPLRFTPPANHASRAKPAVIASAVRKREPVGGNSAWCSHSKTARIPAAKTSASRSEILNKRGFGSAFPPANQPVIHGWRHQNHCAHRTRERAAVKQRRPHHFLKSRTYLARILNEGESTKT